ncbi:MAG: lasso peptide biosynthesis B2 protein [Pyrinomonadaceae bacterium]
MLAEANQFLRGGLRAPMRAVRLARRDPQLAVLMLRMAVWTLYLSALIKFLPLPRALKLIAPGKQRAVSATRARSVSHARLAHAMDALLGANWLVFKPVCWKRAVILHRFLALNGIETRIVFGLRNEKQRELLEGHAWLEANGQPLLEPIHPRYIATYSFPDREPGCHERGRTSL